MKIDPEQLMCLNLNMLKMSHLVLKSYDDAYRPHGVKATQLPVLNLIAQQGMATIKEIAHTTITERSVLSRKLQVMEKNGWIDKQGQPGTQEKTYSITPMGQTLIEKIVPARLLVQQQLLAKLNKSEQEVLLTLCDKLLDNETKPNN